MYLSVKYLKDIELKLWFLSIPFAYTAQVIFNYRYLGLIPFFFLSIYIVKLIIFQSKSITGLIKNRQFTLLSFLVIVYSCFILYSVIVELSYKGLASSIRLFIIYFIPISLYLIFQYIKEDKIAIFINLILVTACIISIDVLFEFFCLEPTWYEVKNYNYIKIASGLDLGWPWGYYRPNGLLEHGHVTGFFLAIGFLASTLFYFYKNNKYYYFILIFCFSGLVAGGVRLALLSGILGLIITIFVYVKTISLPDKKLKKILFVAAGMILSIGILYYFTHANRYFWANIYENMDLTPGQNLISDIILPQLMHIINAMKQNIFHLFFGYGWQTSLLLQKQITSEDIFIAQIFGQLGIIGGVIFYSLFIAGFLVIIKKFKHSSPEQQALLLFAGLILFLLGIATLHSSVIVRKSTYYMLFMAWGIISRFNKKTIKIVDS